MKSLIHHLMRSGAVALLLPTVALAGVAAEPAHRPLRIIQTTEVRLSDLLDADIAPSGEARFLVLVDDTGKLQDLLLVGSTHPSFTRAAVAALQEWKIEPALENGLPVWTRTTVSLAFSTRGRVVTVQGAEVLAGLVGAPFAPEFKNRLALESELDAPLHAVQKVTPGFPVQMQRQVAERPSVLVNFYVDETGRPRMPVITRSEHPVLAQAALDAIGQWRFAPPTRRRLPVVVRATQEFVFFASGTEASVSTKATAE